MTSAKDLDYTIHHLCIYDKDPHNHMWPYLKWHHGITGYIDTALGSGDEGKMISEQFTALGRVGTPGDLSGVFHFLAAEESAYMTGQALVVDGGWSCGPTPQILETILGSSTVS